MPELLLLCDDCSPNMSTRRSRQFRIGPAHQPPDLRYKLTQKWAVASKQPTVPDGATHNLAQYIPATFVGGQQSVGDEKCSCAGVISNDAKRSCATFAFFQFFFFLKIDATQFGRAFQ